MSDLDALLSVQAHDTALEQLRHRRANLPEQQALDAVMARLTALEASLAPTRAELARLQTGQDELEHAIAEVDTKIEHAEKSLYAGTTTSPRELQALEADIASLRKHRGELEEREIALLIEREPHDAAIAAADTARAGIDGEAVELRVRVAEAGVSIDAEIADHTSARATAVASVPAELLALYEKVRAANRGIGVARLEHGTCMGCRMKLAAVDLDRIRKQPADALVRCEECGAILAR